MAPRASSPARKADAHDTSALSEDGLFAAASGLASYGSMTLANP